MIDQKQEALQSGDVVAMHRITGDLMKVSKGGGRRTAFRVNDGSQVASNHNIERQVFVRILLVCSMLRTCRSRIWLCLTGIVLVKRAQ